MYLINLPLSHRIGFHHTLVLLCKHVVLFLFFMELLLEMLVFLLFLLEFLCVGGVLLLTLCFCAVELCGELSVCVLEVSDVFG